MKIQHWMQLIPKMHYNYFIFVVFSLKKPPDVLGPIHTTFATFATFAPPVHTNTAKMETQNGEV